MTLFRRIIAKSAIIISPLSFLMGCSFSESTSKGASQDSRSIVSGPLHIEKREFEVDSDDQIETSERLACGELKYELMKVYNARRQARDVKLVKINGETVHTVEMPTQGEFQGFSVNWAKRIDEGFEISIEWGTRIYHEMRFGFVCEQNDFVLTKIKHNTFDKHFPGDSNKYNYRAKRVTPGLPFEKFVITDFMVD